jgi:hypothetical protein
MAIEATEARRAEAACWGITIAPGKVEGRGVSRHLVAAAGCSLLRAAAAARLSSAQCYPILPRLLCSFCANVPHQA